MKVLYIGHYREGTGWSEVTINQILALDSVGVNVVCRPIKLNNNQPEIPERLIELENKPLNDCDIVIQHVLPHYMEYNGRFKKNIAYFEYETLDIRHTGWFPKLTLMDEIWVPCEQQWATCFINNELQAKGKINVVHHPVNLEKYHLRWNDKFKTDPLPIKDNPDQFMFYYIGEYSRRKNLSSLLRAYYGTFTQYDNVGLVIKANKPGLKPEQVKDLIYREIDTVKKQMKLYPGNSQMWPTEIVVTDFVSENDICRLHETANCFVMPSFGESFCAPAMDAFCFTNDVLGTKGTGMDEYLPEEMLIESDTEPCFGMTETFGDLCTSADRWRRVNILDMGYKMKKCQQNPQDFYHRITPEFRTDKMNEFSYLTVGNKMKELLCR